MLALMLVAVIGASLAVRTARTGLLGSRTAAPSVVSRIPWLASSYLDRAAITEQLTDPPQPTMGELLREHPVLAEQIAQIMAERDERREQLTRDPSNGSLSDAANTLLQRIRAFFAIE